MSTLRSLTAVAGALAIMGCTSPPQQQQPLQSFVKPFEVVRHGTDPQTLYRTGRYFQGQLRFDQAIDAYRQVLAAQPGNADALNALGVIYSQQNRPELAEQSFRLALQSDPGAARVHNNLGYHLMQNGRVAEAIVSFERARELDPGNVDTGVNLASARARMGLPAEAPAQLAAAPAQAVAAPAQAIAAQTVAAPAAVPTPAVVSLPAPAAAPAQPTVPVALDRVADGVYALGVAKPQPQAASAVGQHLEVSNGNGATGLARRVSTLLSAQGAGPARLTNSKPYGTASSTIQYVAGAERMARDINARLPAPLPLAPIAGLERNVQVRVLLGKDFPPSRLAATDSTRRNSWTPNT